MVGKYVNGRMKEVGPAELPEWQPIGDIGNLLVCLDPPPGITVPEKLSDHLRKRLAAVNERLLTAKEDLLRTVSLLLVAARRDRKLWVIRHALRRFSVQTLVTDSQTAVALLKLAELDHAFRPRAGAGRRKPSMRSRRA
jgi:hypothetical protein